MTEMLTGAVAMFDALGFKGIWNRHQHDKVVQRLKGIERAADKIPATYRPGLEEPSARATVDVRTALLSDTVVIGLSVPEETKTTAWEGVPPQTLDDLALAFVAKHVGALISEAGRQEPVLVYRGAISFGGAIGLKTGSLSDPRLMTRRPTWTLPRRQRSG